MHPAPKRFQGTPILERFLRTGELLSDQGFGPDIEASWHRCRELGVDPYAGRCETRMPSAALTRLLADKAELIHIAQPFLHSLYAFVAGLGFVALLFDEAGTLLEAIGDPDHLRAAPYLDFLPGAQWAEQEIGTNGVGTALATGHPVQVSGQEHYCVKHHPWTCSGAPLFDEDHRLIGVLDLTGPVDRTHLHTLGMVVASAQAIQNALGVCRRNRDLQRLNHHLSSVLSAASNGLIVVDGAGCMQGINPAAERVLGMTDDQTRGQNLSALLKETAPLDLLLESGLEFQDRELVFHDRSVACLASGRPIQDDHGRQQGAVLSVNPIHQLRRLVNRFSGSQAVFRFEDILGRGLPLRKALDQARGAALGDTHVLLTGESGTGKEMFAQAIHNHSARASGPFIAVNCGALPRELLASELFGYQEGAFTGARKGGRPGKFELAAGGTLFLDEIGDMPLDQQVSLLRVLQDRAVTRLGGDRATVLDVRIICATHKNLRAEVLRGTFREDLYYRLHVTPIHLPALREHPEDIPLLLDAFLARHGLKPPPPGDGVIPALARYPWPGNIREFQNVVERLLQIARQGPIRIEHLPEEVLTPLSELAARGDLPVEATPLPPLKRLKERLAHQAEQEILQALEAHRGNVSQAAKALGLSRATLYRKMGKLGPEAGINRPR